MVTSVIIVSLRGLGERDRGGWWSGICIETMGGFARRYEGMFPPHPGSGQNWGQAGANWGHPGHKIWIQEHIFSFHFLISVLISQKNMHRNYLPVDKLILS